tara:strand:+ start:489 stop:1166 length:678 start_codon:yes stop_codon:yes gene_type:complete
MKFNAIVPFRKLSKGMINKNFKKIAGIPLWQIAANQATRTCDSLLISTDATENLSTEDDRNIIINMRPERLAKDSTKMSEVIHYLIDEYHLIDENIVLLQPTSPLRTDKSIQQAMNLYESQNFSMVMSVVQKDSAVLKNGFLDGRSFRPINNISYCFENRQSLPNIYGPNGSIYIFSAKNFMKNKDFPTDAIGTVIMDEIESLDINDKYDYEKAEELFSNYHRKI